MPSKCPGKNQTIQVSLKPNGEKIDKVDGDKVRNRLYDELQRRTLESGKQNETLLKSSKLLNQCFQPSETMTSKTHTRNTSANCYSRRPVPIAQTMQLPDSTSMVQERATVSNESNTVVLLVKCEESVEGTLPLASSAEPRGSQMEADRVAGLTDQVSTQLLRMSSNTIETSQPSNWDRLQNAGRSKRNL